MKAIYFIAAVLFLTSCQFQNIEITGTAPGMENATVVITGGGRRNVLFAENIVDGKFTIAQQPLRTPGYYTLNVETSGVENIFRSKRYEVYLEPGKYNITIDTAVKSRYPIITSSSAIQGDLTIYHRFTDSVMRGIREESSKWLNKLNDPKAMLPNKEYQDVLAKVKIWQDKSANAVLTTLNEFVSKYPNNKVIPHAMSNMGLDMDPPKFAAIYNKLGDDVKNSDDGKKVAQKLKTYVKLIPGALAPEIEGLTPDGKKISVKDLHKKAVIIAFWRSGWSIMKDDHFALVNTLIPSLDSKKVGVIGVSFDTDRSKWLETIKKRGLNFTQVSDLKGDDSPNAKNWNTYMLPNYFILDGDGKVLYKDLSYQALVLSINEYMSTH